MDDFVELVSDNPDPRILCINGGSSSIKFALFDAGIALRRILTGTLERIGLPEPTLRINNTNPSDSNSQIVSAPNQEMAVDVVMDSINHHIERNTLNAIGHRMVHGGAVFSAPLKITAEKIEALQQLSPFDPLHLPQQIRLIEAFQEHYPTLPQVACFDTHFHHDMPQVARMLPIPRSYEAKGIRRYGFHGLSYTYLMEELARCGDGAASKGRVILMHLGNGCSMTAVLDGKSIDTSMGFTPSSGLLMGTRCGDIDPGLVSYLMCTEGMDTQQFSSMVNSESGLLGISESSSDMRDLLSYENKDVRAAEAIALFCYQVKKWIGAYAAALGGLDTLVFSGGIGEHAAEVRTRICNGLGFLGIEFDEQRNSKNEILISSSNSSVMVRVIKTDEEFIMAKTVCQLLRLGIYEYVSHPGDSI